MLKLVRNERQPAGAINTLEVLVALPILVLVAVAILEFSLLWSANLRVKEASRAAARVVSLPAANFAELQQAATRAAVQALADARLANNLQLHVEPGAHTGDLVMAEVVVPMTAASPDLLDFFGFSLRDRVLVGQTVMRKE
jgi:hypothetical protein